MFIYVTHKDAPELSLFRQMSSDEDLSVEKLLLVNPYCPVRVMLEYIRRKCKLALMTQFDLCDESGGLKGLFGLPTFAYATGLFEHKRTYYLIVLRQEKDGVLVLPQVNRSSRVYCDLQMKVRRFIITGDVSPQTGTPLKAPTTAAKGTNTPLPKKK